MINLSLFTYSDQPVAFYSLERTHELEKAEKRICLPSTAVFTLSLNSLGETFKCTNLAT